MRRRLTNRARQVVPRRAPAAGPQDDVRDAFVRRRLAVDVGAGESWAAHVQARRGAVQEREQAGEVRRLDADRVIRLRTEARQRAGRREVHDELVVRRRVRLIDPRDLRERDPRRRRTDQGDEPARTQLEPGCEPLPRERPAVGDGRRLHPRALLHADERQRIGPADQDRLAADRAGRQDLRAHATRTYLRSQVLDEARVDGRRPAALRDRVHVPGEDPARERRERGEGRPGRPEQRGAQEESRERAAAHEDGTASFRRDASKAARLLGKGPATPAATIDRTKARRTAPIGASKMTRFGRPRSGATETTAWAATMPRADPRTDPAAA